MIYCQPNVLCLKYWIAILVTVDQPIDKDLPTFPCMLVLAIKTTRKAILQFVFVGLKDKVDHLHSVFQECLGISIFPLW